MSLAVLAPGGDAATALYIVSFSLFIVGIKQGTHPTTAKRGNLIAWSELRHGTSGMPLEILIPTLFAAIVGSVSFWGSNIAFAKLQDLIPTRPLAIPGQQVINGALLIAIVTICVILAVNNGDPSQAIFIAILLAAALLGNLVV